MSPIVCVHGIWDTAAGFEPLASALRARRLGPVHAFDLVPNDGSARIETLAQQLTQQVVQLLKQLGGARVDLVGFSMGALVSRYFVQRLGGKGLVRRFVSIAGPHAGTWTAYALAQAGIRQMRPRSALLCSLAQDEDSFGEVEVHCIYTPFDLMIVPPRSSILPLARSVHAIPVGLHRALLYDRRVHARVARLLGA